MHSSGVDLSEFLETQQETEEKAGDRVQYFLIRESIALSSLLYDAPVLFTSDELEVLKRSGSILYTYYTLYPKDVEGFWIVESLGRFLSKEIDKSRKIQDIEKRLYVSHIPLPIFISRSQKKKIRNAISSLASHYPDKQVAVLLSAYDNLIVLLDRFEDRVYKNLLSYFISGGSRQERNRSVAVSAYRDILKFFGKLENREIFQALSNQMRGVEAFSNVIKRLYPIREDDEMQIDEDSASSFLSNYEQPEKSLIWGYEHEEKTNKNLRGSIHDKEVKERTYAPVGFGGITVSTEDIMTTTLSDFYLHFINTLENPNEENQENSKKIIPYLFFNKYHKQSKANLSAEIDKSKESDKLLEVYIISGEDEDHQKTKDMMTFGILIDLNAKYISEIIKTDFTNRLTLLFKSKDFLVKEKKEQLLYIMATLRQLISEKKEQIPTIQDKYYAKIRIEKLSEYISPILSDGFRLYYNTVGKNMDLSSSTKEENDEIKNDEMSTFKDEDKQNKETGYDDEEIDYDDDEENYDEDDIRDDDL